MGHIAVQKKPEQKVRYAGSIEPFKTYRVVSLDGDREEDKRFVEIGDILVSIPCQLGGREVLNTRTSNLLIRSNGLLDRIRCVRDFTIESVTLAFDENEMPA